MCASELRVALFPPRADVHTGGIERMLKLIEYSHTAGVSFTAHFRSGEVTAPTVARRLRTLVESGRLTVEDPIIPRRDSRGISYDAILIPSEYWIPARRRVRALGLRAPVLIEFQAMPYVSSFDVLKTIGIDSPTLLDLTRFPLVAAKTLADNPALYIFQTAACLYSVRSIARLRNAKVMAVTPVVARGLTSLGLKRRLYVPRVHVGIESSLARKAADAGSAPLYDAVFVGRFHPVRGFLDLPFIVAALKRLLGREVSVAVCGTPHFPRHLRMFESRVREFGLKKNLTMLGWLPHEQLYSVMCKSKALLYPSYADSFSMTVLESLCLGLPVLAYGIDALKMVWAGKTGVFTTPVGAPGAIAESYADIETGGRWDEIRGATRRQSSAIAETYTWENAVACERDFYEDTTDGEGGVGVFRGIE